MFSGSVTGASRERTIRLKRTKHRSQEQSKGVDGGCDRMRATVYRLDGAHQAPKGPLSPAYRGALLAFIDQRALPSP